MAHRTLLAGTGAALLIVAACAPPPAPPLGGSEFAHVAAARVVRYAGQDRCTATLGLDLVLVDDRSMTIHSDVIVRGPGIPEAGLVPCAYAAWTFRVIVSCSDVSTTGCGEMLVPTPDGDVGESVSTFVFPHPPRHSSLTVEFAGTWLGSIADVVPGRVSFIECDPPGSGHRCRFQPAN